MRMKIVLSYDRFENLCYTTRILAWIFLVVQDNSTTNNGMHSDANGLRGHYITEGAIMYNHRRQVQYDVVHYGHIFTSIQSQWRDIPDKDIPIICWCNVDPQHLVGYFDWYLALKEVIEIMNFQEIFRIKTFIHGTEDEQVLIHVTICAE